MPDDRPTGSPRFTPEERALLARYVTNTEGSVFALTHLPEVIKGALFSRYSRSALGLRELLLKEFISDPAAEFAAIGGTAAGGDAEAAAREAHLAVERAQDFYTRILEKFGDDSIGELGGAHLAIENVSMIATKVLEDARIGGSPLEKSTRYVFFGEPVGGDYLFYKEPTLLASRHGERYLATCRMLFETYRELIEPVRAHVRSLLPEVSDIAVRGRTFDALRGLLPASTLTNMGIFGNGRFFEHLIQRLRLGGLAELQQIGEESYKELSKIIPSFIQRADSAHRHFLSLSEYVIEFDNVLQNIAEQLPKSKSRGGEGARLIDFDEFAEQKVLSSLLYSHCNHSGRELRRWATVFPSESSGVLLEQISEARKNRRHKLPRACELAQYTFDIVGDFGMYRDLHRHRMLTQQRQLLSTRYGYDVPKDIIDSGVSDAYIRAMKIAEDTYDAIASEHPREAQYVVPMAYRIRWQITANLRSLCWLVELRSQPQGHEAYRRIAWSIYKHIQRVHPRLAGLIKFVDTTGQRTRQASRHGTEQRQLHLV